MITGLLTIDAPRLDLLTVEAYQVEPGDRLLGCPAVIESVLFHGGDGRWLLNDRHGRIVTTKRTGQTFQVLRGGPSMDDTPASGTLRPSLTAVGL